jgi:hypothetical protein
MEGFGISGIEHGGSATTVLVELFIQLFMAPD